MKIVQPRYILFPDGVKENLAIAYEKQIEKIDTLSNLQKLYPDAELTECKENTLVMPGLVNAHVHLEFSANKTTLKYGSFMPWLYSVISNREDLVNECDTKKIKEECESMLQNGITAFGAISSHGMELEAVASSKQKVVFFNELIGSQAVMADALFGDFVSRLQNSKSIKRDGFKAAIAIHSPYSVHPILVKKALEIAKDEKLPISAHFMESDAERLWLDESDGEFKDFFDKLLNSKEAVTSAPEFLDQLSSTPTLLTHVVKANDEELSTIAKSKHTVVHCPISNRLLGSGAIDLTRLEEQNIEWIIATDGLSSNYTLDLFEEMKIALFMHSSQEANEFALKLLNATTKLPAQKLGLNCGEIAEGKDADMLFLNIDTETKCEDLPLHILLHNYKKEMILINGELV
ncbi:MAG: metal-dependent hydrolase [Helicobacteraceae bacterium]|nr:metal-dependent hydrolase [Helicobacteraceae bacterium]